MSGNSKNHDHNAATLYGRNATATWLLFACVRSDKTISGSLPNVRIAAYADKAGGGAVSGVPTSTSATTLTSYGNVVEVSAIIYSGQRNGVDLVWGGEAFYGHFGLDLTGPNGGIVRIDDVVIEDITSVFLRNIMSVVDVRD